MNLIRLCKVNGGKESEHLPIEKATLYKWRTMKKFPELFVSMGGAVFVDVDRFYQLMEKSRGKKS